MTLPELPLHLLGKPTPPEIHVPSLDALTPNQRMFVLHYVLGDDEVRGIAYKAYIAAGYTAANVNTASAASWQVLRNEKVKKAIREIRSYMEDEFKLRMRSWTFMAIKAQELIERTLDTALDSALPVEKQVHPTANQLYAAKEALDRCLGRPKQPHSLETAGNLDEFIKRINSRLSAAGGSRRVPPDPRMVSEVPPPLQLPPMRLVEEGDKEE